LARLFSWYHDLYLLLQLDYLTLWHFDYHLATLKLHQRR